MYSDTTEPLAIVKPWETTAQIPVIVLKKRKTTRLVYLLSMLCAVLIVASSAALLEIHLPVPSVLSTSVQPTHGVAKVVVKKPVILKKKVVVAKKRLPDSPAGRVAVRVTPTVQPLVFPEYFQHPGQAYGQNGEQGQDYDAPFRSPALALWPGKVFLAERTCWNTSCTSTSGGVVIIISTVPGYGKQSAYYLHLDSIDVVAGQNIKKGQLLGLTGGQLSGGHWPTSPQFSTGPHIEIGACASFLPCPVGYNFDPRRVIQQAIGE